MTKDKKENEETLKLEVEELDKVNGGEGEEDPRLPVIPIKK